MGAHGLGWGRRMEGLGWGRAAVSTVPVLLLSPLLPPGESRVSRKVSSGTWTRDSLTASRARLCGAVTTAAVVSGARGRSAAGEVVGKEHICLSDHLGASTRLLSCPPLFQPALSPPTLCEELTAAGGHSAGQAASPGTGELCVFLTVPVKRESAAGSCHASWATGCSQNQAVAT